MAWTDLCSLDELVVNQGRQVAAAGTLVAVFKLADGTVRVVDDCCPHAGASLSNGDVHEGCVICPRHYWTFSLDNGRMPDGGHETLPTYAVKVESGRVLADLSAPKPITPTPPGFDR